MAGLIRGPIVCLNSGTETLQQRYKTVQGVRWLTDGNIRDVYSTFRKHDATALPDTVLLLSPAQALMLAVASDQDVAEQVFEMHLPSRDFVLVPLNDASARGHDGKHWSLLIVVRSRGRSREEPVADAVTCYHLDSAQMACHEARAALVGQKLLGQGARVETTKCAMQRNGRDCGIYLLLFSEIALACFLESSSWLAFRLKKSWREAVAAVSPERAEAYRAMLQQTYNRGIALQEGIAPILDVDEPDGCDCGWAAGEMKWHHPDCPLHSDRQPVAMKRPASVLAEEQSPPKKTAAINY